MLNDIDLSRTDLNLLTVFEAVLAEGHVGRAAARLNLTPSAISHGLGRLRRLFNDPLFLRTPRGVVATARATELGPAIADVLARVRRVVASAEPFEASTSTRRFTIGAPDGVSAVFLPALLGALGRSAPRVALGVRQLLPVPGETAPERAWVSAFADLEARKMDIAVIPTDQAPARFHRRALAAEDFVIVRRAGQPLPGALTLARYCALDHLVVSQSGDAQGFVDERLARQGRQRRVALTVPNFMLALAIVADTDLAAAVPRRLAASQATRFGLVVAEPPLALGRFGLQAVASKAAMMDAGVAWLLEALAQAMEPAKSGGRGRAAARARTGLRS